MLIVFFEFCGFINKIKNDLFCPPTLEIKISMCPDWLKITFSGTKQSWAKTQENVELALIPMQKCLPLTF